MVKFFLGLFILSSCVLMDKTFLSGGADKKADKAMAGSQKPAVKFEPVEAGHVKTAVQKPAVKFEPVEAGHVKTAVQKPAVKFEPVEAGHVKTAVQKPAVKFEPVEAGHVKTAVQKPAVKFEPVEAGHVKTAVQKPAVKFEPVEAGHVKTAVQKPAVKFEPVEAGHVKTAVQKPAVKFEPVEAGHVKTAVQKPAVKFEPVEAGHVKTAVQKPVFKFETVESAWLAKYPEIYKEFKNLVELQKKEVESMAKAVKREFPNSHSFPYKLSIESVEEFNKKDSNIISVRTAIYTFTGGAHGMLYHVSWNWDKEKGKFISLDRYVKTSDQFKKLQSGIRSALSQKVESGFVNKDLLNGAISEKKNLKTWNIHNNSIVFMFDPYAIGSYAAGPIEVTVPIP